MANIHDDPKVEELALKLREVEEKLIALEDAKHGLTITTAKLGTIATVVLFGDRIIEIGNELETVSKEHDQIGEQFKQALKDRLGIDYQVTIENNGDLKEYKELTLQDILKDVLNIAGDALRRELESHDCDVCDQKDNCPIRPMKEAYLMGASPEQVIPLFGSKMTEH